MFAGRTKAPAGWSRRLGLGLAALWLAAAMACSHAGPPQPAEPPAVGSADAAEAPDPASEEAADPAPAAVAGEAPAGPEPEPGEDDSAPGEEEADSEGALDRVNRGFRTFNFWMLDYFVHPIARGWNVIMPKWGQRRIRNIFENLERPRDMVNSMLQWKPGRAGRHLGAFLIDTTAGLAGMFTLSEHVFGFVSPETFNETLGVWGLPPGAFVILPVLGETSPRGMTGSVVDTAMHPLFWFPGGTTGTIVSAGRTSVTGVNLLALQMPPPFSSESEWDAYFEVFHARPTYPEAKQLFFENQQLDVED